MSYTYTVYKSDGKKVLVTGSEASAFKAAKDDGYIHLDTQEDTIPAYTFLFFKRIGMFFSKLGHTYFS